MKEAGPCEVVLIIIQGAYLAAWNYLHDNIAFHTVFNYIHFTYIVIWSIQRSIIDFLYISHWLHASEFTSGDRERSSGFLKVILFPLKMIQLRFALFE